MAGGITWRLAVEEGFDLVYDGPTDGLSRTRAGVRYATDNPDWQYWDDDCTVRELDRLCGAYICYHGEINVSPAFFFSDQLLTFIETGICSPPFTVRSWWPLRV